MARWYEPTENAKRDWAEWVAERPPDVRKVAKQFPPWILYRMGSTGRRVTLRGFDKGDTICARVVVDERFNCILFGREVFGVDPADLQECELPEPGELVGSPETGAYVIDSVGDADTPWRMTRVDK